MARKPTQPAMYELLRPTPQQRPASVPTVSAGSSSTGGPSMVAGGGGGGSGGGGGHGHLEPAGAGAPGPAVPVGPGRFVKIPVGYAYVAIAAALAALVCVYIYGFSAGENSSAKRFEQRRIEELNAQSNLPTYDPLTAGKRPSSLQNEGAGNAPGGDRGRNPPGSGGEASRPAVNGDGGAGQDLGPAPGGDPRQPGLNYFVLAHAAALKGAPMVEFCRKNGLDAHLVPDDNGELRLVIVCPGFSGGERQSAAVKALEAKIRSVGLKWKSSARGNGDFGDLYPKKHKSA